MEKNELQKLKKFKCDEARFPVLRSISNFAHLFYLPMAQSRRCPRQGRN